MPETFSVVLPTRQRDDLLAHCLDGLAPGAQKLPAERYEVIVTDDGSERTAEALVRNRYPWARWRPGPRRGPAANRNSAARHATGDWLAFVDDDCIPGPGWLAAYAEAIRADGGFQVFEGPVHTDRPRRTLAEIAPAFSTGGSLPSGNSVFRRTLFAELGGFDERFPFPAMEDVELRQRLTDAGIPFSFVPDAAVCHPWRPKGGWAALRRHQQSVLIFLSIHPEQYRVIRANYAPAEIWRCTTRESLPGLVRFRGRGASEALLEHVAAVVMRQRLNRLGRADRIGRPGRRPRLGHKHSGG